MVLPGYIKKRYPYGSFVHFPNGLVGLAPVKHLKDEFVVDAVSVFKDKQSVLAKVLELDEEKERFLVSLRCSDLRLSLTKSSELVESEITGQFERFLLERDLVLKQLALSGMQLHVIKLFCDFPHYQCTCTCTCS